MDQISAYFEENRKRLERILNSDNGLIFGQPIAILVNYYFDKHNSYLRRNWEVDQEILKAVWFANDTTFENY